MNMRRFARIAPSGGVLWLVGPWASGQRRIIPS
jgi:hypothetical protein